MPRGERVAGNTLRNRVRAFWRKTLQPIWQDIEWPLVGGIWVLALVLGFIGFSRHALAAGQASTFWDNLHRALQLIVLQSGDVAGPVPWQLEVARFLMPAVAGYAAIQTLLALFREQWHLMGLRVMKNHAVVCGLGERGLRLTQDFLDQGFRVVVVEKDEENPLIGRCREAGSIVLVGDAKDRNLLRRAGTRRAKYLVSVCADDGVNAEIALQARDLVRSRGGRALNAFVHIQDLELFESLTRGAEKAAGGEPFRLEFFNALDRGALLMLAEYPPFDGDARKGDGPPHLLVVGLGKLGRSLVVRAARRWAVTGAGGGGKLRISVIDKAGGTKMALVRQQNPRLNEFCDVRVIELEKNAPEFDRGAYLRDDQDRCDLDAIYICFDDDVHALVDALTLRRRTGELGAEVPIVMRMSREAGLATLLREERSGFDFSRLHAFGLLDRTCTLEALLGGWREILARTISEDVGPWQASAAPERTRPSMGAWDRLPEEIKQARRRRAALVEAELDAIGCGIEPLDDWEVPSFEFSDEEIGLLAERGLDRVMARGLPAWLAQAGFQIRRRS